MKKIWFGGGCFWGIEYAFSQLEGVQDSVSGYAGGHTKNPTYREVCSGETGHAEVVEVTYDPGRVSLNKLLDFFFKIHDPTQLNRQGPDYGTQYRSIIMADSDEEIRQASEYRSELQNTGQFAKPVVTEITRMNQFYRAEDYHQDYVRRTGRGCHINLDFLGQE